MTENMSADLTEQKQAMLGHVYAAFDIMTLALCLWYFKSLVNSAVTKSVPQEGPRQRPEVSISASESDSTGNSFGRVSSGSSGSDSGSPRTPARPGLDRQASSSRLAF